MKFCTHFPHPALRVFHRTGKKEKETPRRPRFDIPGEILKELRELGFSWIKIGEMLGVSRWTIHRRIEDYGLQNMAGFHHLPDEEQRWGVVVST